MWFSGEVDIGNLIRETAWKISPSNELMIGGRRCIIDRSYEQQWVATGDLVKVDHQRRIYICGRLIEQIVESFSAVVF